jgi:3-methylfumaryl-CoA hydratase
MMPTLDPEVLSGWVGRSESRLDRIEPGRARLMQATLGQEATLQEGDPLPRLWHWLYFADEVPSDALAADGLAAPGPILPPVDLPNRMWGGARFEINEPLRVGQLVERHREIVSVDVKEGRSGPLCLVTLRDTFLADAQTHFSEEQDIVYRMPPEKGRASKPVETPYQAQFEEVVTPDEVLLFRYSALTFNSHRIHYDPDYCRAVEGYPGLIVHGPLTATLLSGLAERNAVQRIRQFRLRATSPLFAGHPVRLAGRKLDGRIHVWAETMDGSLAMDAEGDY